MTTRGQCLCGKVEVTVKAPLKSYPTLSCHCTSCKRRSGGTASYAFCVPAANLLSITGSTHRTYSDSNTGSGHPMQRSMCTDCGSPVMIIEASQPDTRCLQYGLFADCQDVPKPGKEMFWSKRWEWEKSVGEEVSEEQ